MRTEKSVDPTKLKKWLIALGVAYLLFPRDLLPDYLGRGLGFAANQLPDLFFLPSRYNNQDVVDRLNHFGMEK